MRRSPRSLQAVLLLRDGFSGAPIRDASVMFRLDGEACEPLSKVDGFFVFPNLLPRAPNRLHVVCRGFVSFEVALTTFSVPLEQLLTECVVVHRLEPGWFYTYPVDTTIVCGKVRTEEEPLGDVDVFVVFPDRLGTWQWRKTKSYQPAHERDASHGFYALALPLTAAGADLKLRFTKDGHVPHFDCVTVARSRKTIVDACLQRENA